MLLSDCFTFRSPNFDYNLESRSYGQLLNLLLLMSEEKDTKYPYFGQKII